ncbi:hypothetical protein D3C77_503140 [compost metagenome]
MLIAIRCHDHKQDAVKKLLFDSFEQSLDSLNEAFQVLTKGELVQVFEKSTVTDDIFFETNKYMLEYNVEIIEFD